MPGRAADWLQARPELVDTVRQGRLDGWSWETIRGWLYAEHRFGFTTSSLITAGRTLGIS